MTRTFVMTTIEKKGGRATSKEKRSLKIVRPDSDPVSAK